ncbi:MAG: hypothetical protein ACTSXH_09905 [Promethearchaeota archaeon]
MQIYKCLRHIKTFPHGEINKHEEIGVNLVGRGDGNMGVGDHAGGEWRLERCMRSMGNEFKSKVVFGGLEVSEDGVGREC